MILAVASHAPRWVQAIGEALALAIALATLAAFGWLIWNRALTEVQSKAMEVQADTIAAYETRIKQLEESVEQASRERAEMVRLVGELRARVDGQKELAHAIIEAVAGTHVCLNAPDCPNHVVPSI
jgi:ATP-dependent Clp protease ATP-binding subunit ClpA